LSGSAAEVFTSGMQEIGRAIVIGRPTVGGVLPAVQEPLPTGGLLVHAVGIFKTPRGKVIEGVGVKPDIEARWTRDDLLGGRDPFLQAAETKLAAVTGMSIKLQEKVANLK